VSQGKALCLGRAEANTHALKIKKTIDLLDILAKFTLMKSLTGQRKLN
jgi:hypothetical protein